MTRKKYSIDQFFNDAKAVLTKRNYFPEDYKLEVQVSKQEHDTLGMKAKFIIQYSNDLEYNLEQTEREYIFSSGKTPEDCLKYFDNEILRKLGINPEYHRDNNFSSDISI